MYVLFLFLTKLEKRSEGMAEPASLHPQAGGHSHGVVVAPGCAMALVEVRAPPFASGPGVAWHRLSKVLLGGCPCLMDKIVLIIVRMKQPRVLRSFPGFEK